MIQIHQNEGPADDEANGDENVIAESSLDKPTTVVEKPKRGNVLNLVRESTIKNRAKPLRSMLDEDASVSTADKAEDTN